MHLIRRSVVRASSSTASIRTLNTSTPFALRAKTQQSSLVPSAFRRYSDDAEKGETVRTSDGENSAVNAAIDSASESFGNSAGEGYAPREPSQHDNGGEGRPSYGDGTNGGERGGFGGRGGGGYGGGGRGNFGGGDHGGNRGGYGAGSRDISGGDRPRFERPTPAPAPSVYVGNLLFDVTAADLEKQFAEFGNVITATVATDTRGLSKGFGYVEFETVEEATKAIEGKNDTQHEGRRIIVNYMNQSKRKEPRPENPPSKTLFIGNLAFEMSDADLNKLFRDIKNVIDVRVAIDRRTGQPRGFAHADFVDVESAIAGREILLGKEAYGRQIRVDYSSTIRENRGRDRPNF